MTSRSETTMTRVELLANSSALVERLKALKSVKPLTLTAEGGGIPNPITIANAAAFVLDYAMLEEIISTLEALQADSPASNEGPKPEEVIPPEFRYSREDPTQVCQARHPMTGAQCVFGPNHSVNYHHGTDGSDGVANAAIAWMRAGSDPTHEWAELYAHVTETAR